MPYVGRRCAEFWESIARFAKLILGCMSRDCEGAVTDILRIETAERQCSTAAQLSFPDWAN
jgi:hypothetical protein